MRRVAFALLVALVALVAAVGVWHPARVAAQTLLLLPALFPAAPIDPLAWITSTPAREHQTDTYSAGTIDSDVFTPDGGGRHPAIMLLLGAGDLPQIGIANHFADELARLGIVTMIPLSSGMLAEHLTFDEIDAIRVSLNALTARSDVDPTRVGIVGLSASGGLSIVAAAQPDLRDRITFVNSFGSYDDARSLIVDVASRSISVDEDVRPWTPEPRTIEVVGNALIDAGVDDATRAELVDGTSRERATQLVDGLSPEAQARLAAVSPSRYLDRLRTHLYLMHDTDDPFIPFTESRELVASAPPGVVVRYTEFSIFEHVIPDRPVPWQTFLPDLWRLFWHVHAVLSEVL